MGKQVTEDKRGTRASRLVTQQMLLPSLRRRSRSGREKSTFLVQVAAHIGTYPTFQPVALAGGEKQFLTDRSV